MKKLIPVLLMLALSLSVVPGVALAQQNLTTPSVGRIKTDIARRLLDEKTDVTIGLRNGSELKGRFTQAAENVFSLKENKTGIKHDINYADVASARCCLARRSSCRQVSARLLSTNAISS